MEFEPCTALFDPSCDMGGVERMVTTWATDPAGVGFDRAHLLIWNTQVGAFDGRWSAVATPEPMEARLVAAGRPSGDRDLARETRTLRALRFEPDDLGPAVTRLWSAGRVGMLGPDAARAFPWAQAARIGVVVLREGACPRALLLGEWSGRSWRAGSRRLERLRVAANHALEAAAGREAQRRARLALGHIADLSRLVASPGNVAEVAQRLTRLACEATQARGAALWQLDADQGAPRLIQTYGPDGTRDRIGRGLQPLAEACADSGKPRVEDALGASAVVAGEVAVELCAVALQPLIAYGRVWGVLAIYDRMGLTAGDPMAFDAEDLTRLASMADLGAIAFAVADREERQHRLEEARRDLLIQLERSERFAVLGEHALQLARDARNPLASIAAFARRVHRALPAEDAGREHLEVILREVERLESTIGHPADLEIAPPGGLAIESVNALVQAALQAHAETLVRRRIRLLKNLSADLPPLLLDGPRLGSVFHNAVRHALERTAAGGRVRIESRRVQGFVVVEVASDGPLSEGTTLEELFVPFALVGSERGNTGLALARQVVAAHGGEVRVRRQGEWASVLLITLPVTGNQDRRRPGGDRRILRLDRRLRSPAA